METVFGVLRLAWGFFSDIVVPGLGIPFASLFLGVAVIHFSIRILKPLLGVGSSSARDASLFASRHKPSSRSNDSKGSYNYSSTSDSWGW